MKTILRLAAATAMLGTLGLSADAQNAPREMTFFVTSVGMNGSTANLGGLAGADAHCAALAQAVGAPARTWRAYLSTQAAGGTPAVNARDRIGSGPWRNASGAVIARSVADLHSDSNNLTKATALSERGQPINGRGDTPNMHDVLTGTQADGTAFPPGQDRTCRNWTYDGEDGAAMVGHSDRLGLSDDAVARSWNATHASRNCTAPGLRATGGAGLLYCFAAQ